MNERSDCKGRRDSFPGSDFPYPFPPLLLGDKAGARQYSNTPAWLTMEKDISLTWTSLRHTQAIPAPEGRQLALEGWLSQGYQGFLCTFWKSLLPVLAGLLTTYPDFHRITESNFHLEQVAWSSDHRQWLREKQGGGKGRTH